MTESPYTTGVNPPECGRIRGETDGPESAGNALCPALTPEEAAAGMHDSNAPAQAKEPPPYLPSFSHSDSCERYYTDDADTETACTCGATKAQEWLDALVAERNALAAAMPTLNIACPDCGHSPPHTRIEASANHPELVECGVYEVATGCGATWHLEPAPSADPLRDLLADKARATAFIEHASWATLYDPHGWAGAIVSALRELAGL